MDPVKSIFEPMYEVADALRELYRSKASVLVEQILPVFNRKPAPVRVRSAGMQYKHNYQR